jgi:predicted dienelactone hydrolase
MRTIRVLFALLLIVLLVNASLTIQAQGKGPEQVGLRPDAPEYAKHGPYWVGARDFIIDKDSKKPIAITVWYPALNPEGAQEAIEYLANVYFMELPAGVKPIVKGHALRDADPDSAKAPYPLVIYSHGFQGFRELSTFLCEHLASNGFVVIAPDHKGDVNEIFYASIIKRLVEVKRVITYADMLTAKSGTLAGVIDTEKIAVIGHSAGGITSYGAAGAPINWTTIEAYCAQAPEDPACSGDPKTLKKAMLDAAGLEAEPQGLWPPIWDSRVDAIIPMTGSFEEYGQEGLAKVTVPALIMYGSLDWLFLATPDVVNTWLHPIYDKIASSQKGNVIFTGGNHLIFFDSCEALPFLLNLDLFSYCSDSVWDMDRAHDLINHFTTAFLLDVLKGDKEAHKALLPDAVKFAGIEYKTTMK